MANTQGTTGLLGWIDERFPLTKMMREHLTEYYAPKNFNSPRSNTSCATWTGAG